MRLSLTLLRPWPLFRTRYTHSLTRLYMLGCLQCFAVADNHPPERNRFLIDFCAAVLVIALCLALLVGPSVSRHVAVEDGHAHSRRLKSTISADSCLVVNFSGTCPATDYPIPACCTGGTSSDICNTDNSGADQSCPSDQLGGCCPT